jgi:NADH:ubiquinone oxidoreductase subunit C
MKAHLTDPNLTYIIYINKLLSTFNQQYVFNQKIQFNQITMYLANLNYNIILNLKELNIFSFKTLSDLTAVNYPGFFKEFELHYLLLSYKLSMRCALKYFINKEDLVLSFINIYINSN